jgi:hypothetical protein
MLAPDETTRRAVEASARAVCSSEPRFQCRVPCGECTRVGIRAAAAYLDAMGQDIAAARVRRCLNTNTDEGGV